MARPRLRERLLAELQRPSHPLADPPRTTFSDVAEDAGWDVANSSISQLRATMQASMNVGFDDDDDEDAYVLSDILDQLLLNPVGGPNELEIWADAVDLWLPEHLDQPLLLEGSGYGRAWAAFLAYKLAWELAPDSAVLRIIAQDGAYESEQSRRDLAHAVVHDVYHNVVYDLSWCFIGVSAVELLAKFVANGADETERWWRHKADWREGVLDTRLFHKLRFRVGLPAEILSLLRRQVVGSLDVRHVADWDFGGGEKERQLKRAIMPDSNLDSNWPLDASYERLTHCPWPQRVPLETPTTSGPRTRSMSRLAAAGRSNNPIIG